MKHDHWLWEAGTIPSNICDEWIARFDSQVTDGGVSTAQDSIDLTLRRSKIHFVEDKAIQDYMKYFAETANRNAFGADVSNYIECQFTRYDGDDEGFYEYHLDLTFEGRKPAFDRKVSLVVLLSDPSEFTGGDLMLMGDRIDLKKGSVVAFPSFYPHKVTEVTQGTRYSMVSWLEGPRWR